jgi:hypothetical protein
VGLLSCGSKLKLICVSAYRECRARSREFCEVQSSGRSFDQKPSTDHFRHAGRSKINIDDVMLLTRRNEDLAKILKDFAEKEKAKVKAEGKKAAR